MSEGLATTFGVLSKTRNEAAVGALLPALDSPYLPIQEGALEAILARRSLAGGREILRRLHTMPPQWKAIVEQRPGRMDRALRDAALGSDADLFRNACQAAIWLRAYDLVPALLKVLEDPARRESDLAAETLLALVGQLREQLTRPRGPEDRRDPELLRQHVLESLRASVDRFGRHGRRQPIEAFLVLADRASPALRAILDDRHHPALPVVREMLSGSSHPAVLRLLTSFLNDPAMPLAALVAICHRSDPEFVRLLLRKIGPKPSTMVQQNLKRIVSIAWLKPGQTLVAQLDEASQQATVRLVMHSGVPRWQGFAIVELLLLHGWPAARREAANALAEFTGAEVNALALKALEDQDPQVQAHIIAQLRRRAIPRVLPRLVAMLDSPHAEVRQAAREALDEFTFPRFLGAFDMLDDDVRQSTGMLVKKIDPHTLPRLRSELESRARTRRLRGLAIAQSIDVVGQLEPVIAGMLKDEDHMVRAEAAAALVQHTNPATRRALQEALSDHSLTVREAARRTLQQLAQSTPRRGPTADLRD